MRFKLLEVKGQPGPWCITIPDPNSGTKMLYWTGEDFVDSAKEEKLFTTLAEAYSEAVSVVEFAIQKAFKNNAADVIATITLLHIPSLEGIAYNINPGKLERELKKAGAQAKNGSPKGNASLKNNPFIIIGRHENARHSSLCWTGTNFDLLSSDNYQAFATLNEALKEAQTKIEPFIYDYECPSDKVAADFMIRDLCIYNHTTGELISCELLPRIATNIKKYPLDPEAGIFDLKGRAFGYWFSDLPKETVNEFCNIVSHSDEWQSKEKRYFSLFAFGPEQVEKQRTYLKFVWNDAYVYLTYIELLLEDGVQETLHIDRNADTIDWFNDVEDLFDLTALEKKIGVQYDRDYSDFIRKVKDSENDQPFYADLNFFGLE